MKSIVVATLLASTALAPAADYGSSEVQTACKRAVRYLMSQRWGSGCIQDLHGRKIFSKHRDSQPPREGVAMTALAIMGMAAVGHLPTDPTEEGRAMRMALEFVLRDSHQASKASRRGQFYDGYYGFADHSRMYGHGIITLMLAEMLGMGVDENMDRRLRDSCQSAVDLILRSQRHRRNRSARGGWRYEPNEDSADLSVTVWQVMALRAAKNAGLEVPTSSIESAIGYIRRCYQRGRGMFSYETNGGNTSFSTTAEGLLSMQVCGQYEAKEVLAASDYLLENGPRYGDQWFFYGTYYYAQGMAQRGGEYASTAKRMTAKVMLDSQRRDGSWHARGGMEGGAGSIYATSMALLSLSVHHNFLPIYQR